MPYPNSGLEADRDALKSWPDGIEFPPGSVTGDRTPGRPGSRLPADAAFGFGVGGVADGPGMPMPVDATDNGEFPPTPLVPTDFDPEPPPPDRCTGHQDACCCCCCCCSCDTCDASAGNGQRAACCDECAHGNSSCTQTPASATAAPDPQVPIGGHWQTVPPPPGVSDQLPTRTWAEGPAGDVGANSRAPWGAMPLTPAQLLYRTHGCCPGQEWQGTVYRNEWGDSAPGCYPPICEADGSIPAGIRFARGVTPACIPRPPGWDPRWGCWGFSSGTSGNAPPPAGWQPQSIAPSPQAGLPAQPQPIPLPQFNGTALATPDAGDPLPAPPRDFGESKYPLASPPSSTFPGAPDYLYITIGNRLPLQSTAPELIPEAPVGYAMVRMIPFGEYPHWDLLYESQPTGPFYSFVFQYIDSRIRAQQHGGGPGQQVQQPPGPVNSSPGSAQATSETERIPRQHVASSPNDCGVLRTTDPSGTQPDASAQPTVVPLRFVHGITSTCPASHAHLSDGIEYYRRHSLRTKPIEYRGTTHTPFSAAATTVDRAMVDFIRLSLIPAAKLRQMGDFADVMEMYIGDRPMRASVDPLNRDEMFGWLIPVDRLIDEVPPFASEVYRLKAAIRYWATHEYASSGNRAYVMTGPMSFFTIPSACNMNWFGCLHNFVYWYVACVGVTPVAQSVEPDRGRARFEIEWIICAADYFEFQAQPRRAPAPGTSLALGETDLYQGVAFDPRSSRVDGIDDDGGDVIPLPPALRDWINLSSNSRLFPRRLLVPSEFGMIAPPFITSRRFAQLYRCGLGHEFASAGYSGAGTIEFRA